MQRPGPNLFFTLLSLGLPWLVQAGDTDGAMTISGFLADDVALVLEDVNFGDLSSDAITSVSSASAIQVSAALGLPYQVEVDAGDYCGSCTGTGDRQLLSQTDGSSTIGYRLYQDAAKSVEWGDAGKNHHGAAREDVGTGSTRSYYVYADADPIPVGHPVGICQDNLTVTVVW